jgi:hypothetical protein
MIFGFAREYAGYGVVAYVHYFGVSVRTACMNNASIQKDYI